MQLHLYHFNSTPFMGNDTSWRLNCKRPSFLWIICELRNDGVRERRRTRIRARAHHDNRQIGLREGKRGRRGQSPLSLHSLPLVRLARSLARRRRRRRKPRQTSGICKLLLNNSAVRVCRASERLPARLPACLPLSLSARPTDFCTPLPPSLHSSPS